MTALLLLMVLLWVPGAVLHRAFGLARGPWGCGVLAIEAALSLAFLSVLLLPFYVAGAPVVSAAGTAVAAIAMLVLAAVTLPQRRRLLASQGSSSLETAAFLAALVLLVPVTAAYSGANVDDWWDLSFVSGWLADGRFGFAQMALTPDPDSQASPLHPRFLWSVWLMLQAVVSALSGQAAWKVQAGALAAVTCMLVVSSQAALARALFRELPQRERLVAATLVLTPAWIWGTDALPLFVRGYQDKLVAAFVLAPVLLALVIEASRGTGASGDRYIWGQVHFAPVPVFQPPDGAAPAQANRGHRVLAVAAASIATVSVHSLVFTMAAFVALLAIVARQGRRSAAWALANKATLAALLLPGLYPLAQALVLSALFGEQGISLTTPDNPVVRAHLSLGRLVGAGGPAWIVHPAAAFGSVAVLLPAAFVLLWRRRREPSLRVLLAIAALPCLLLFVPGLAALAGKLWVPWMLYRLGWMVPVTALLAWLLVEGVSFAGRKRPDVAGRTRSDARARGAAFALLAAIVLVLAASTAADRLRRNMREHPGPPLNVPTAAAAAVFDFLAAQPGRDAVLAPPNFSELVPAISAKPVVAFSERGTLVFAGDEERAYERLRDRASFFAPSSEAAARDAIAQRYAVRWAVLPRRLVASGSERTWLSRFGPEALLAARAADGIPGDACDGSWCRGWWSATRASATRGLGPSWGIVFETRDYFVAERSGRRELQPRAVAAGKRDGPRWLAPFELSPQAPAAAPADVLASAVSAPGAVVHYDVPPRFALPSVAPIWIEGPGAWEDAPASISIRIDLGVACRLTAIELQPHLPHERRDVLELRSGDELLRAAARHGRPLRLPLGDAPARSQVTVQVTSLLGAPVSLADLRVLGDRHSCAQGWPVLASARTPQMTAHAGGLLDLAAAVPPGGRALVSLARQVRRRSNADAIALLDEASRREPSLVEAWLELGFTLDAAAADVASQTDGAGGANAAVAARRRARAAFHAATRADSRSAWARGSAAWSDQRAGHPVVALWNAVMAAQVDPLYGDAWTVAAYALGDLGLHQLAERALAAAAQDDPDRNWPVLARADLAISRHHDDAGSAAGVLAAARGELLAWLERHPFDASAREKLSAVVALAAADAPPP